MLLDNCILPDGGIDFRNRGVAGSGHGWSLGWSVAWNCLAKKLTIHNPPGSANWAIGSSGERLLLPRNMRTEPIIPEGIFDSYGIQVTPRSLYLAQLSERLGAQSLKNIGYGPGSPASLELENPTIPISRIYPQAPVDPEFGINLAFLQPVDASSMRISETDDPNKYSADNALDGNLATYWMPRDINQTAQGGRPRPFSFEIDANPPLIINALTISEPTGITNVRAYKIDAVVDDEYQTIAEGTTIGERKTHTFPQITVWKIRLTILESEGTPAISELTAHLK